MTIRVLICDDHRIVREGIKQILAEASDLRVMGEAANGPEAIQQVRAGIAAGSGPEVVLLDIAMPQRDGLDILKALRSEFPKLPVLMLSTYPDRQYAVRSLKLGAAGYLNKSADSEQMIDAVRTVARGRRFIAADDGMPLHEVLSHREHQVFQMLVAGRSVGEIAEQLVLSSNTVSTYRARILEKTGVRNDVELTLFAVRRELLSP